MMMMIKKKEKEGIMEDYIVEIANTLSAASCVISCFMKQSH